MYLIPTELVAPHINPFFLRERQGWKLLGFMSCTYSNGSLTKYYSVATTHGRVVPVYWLSEGYGGSKPVLFFMGCDDGHTGIHFTTEEEAMQWLSKSPYGGFDSLFRASCDGDIPPLEFFN